jgi:hypothetical protein
LVDFFEVDAKKCTGIRSCLLRDVLDNRFDVFVFPHVRGLFLALLFKTLEDGVRDCAVSLERGCDSIKICMKAESLVCARH